MFLGDFLLLNLNNANSLNDNWMKRNMLMAALFLAATVGFAAKTESKAPWWMDPSVNRVNTLTPRASFFAYESAELAQKNQKESSSRFMTLEGDWNFNWVKDHDKAPAGFYAVDYDDSKWVKFPVPGLFEIHGYGDRIYKNVGYAWATQFSSNPPYIEEKNNYTGSYRKEFEIPADWKGDNIYMHVGSATSNLMLWVNGKFVGYSEDSKAEVEFDLTKFLQPGKKNLIAMQVMRWCDGSYLEDQDFWRFTGIAREVYLYAAPKARVSDVYITPDLVNNYRDGKLDVKVSAENANGQKVSFELKDQTGKTVATAEGKVTGGKLAQTIELSNPQKWTAETPYLYTLYITLGDAKAVKAVIPQRVGFRKVEIKNSQLLVNGAPVLIKGVDRHELDPNGGYVISVDRMIQDIQVMKRMNVNAVRTCHYQDDPRWYDLCDYYGIYMTAETNIESHGMGYGDRTLAQNPDFLESHLERQRHNIYVNKNHPAIIVWSLGNEAGMGVNFEKSYALVKAYDPSRPVQYERACFPYNGFENDGSFKMDYTDIYCPMYESPHADEVYLKKNVPQPLIQCEYAHAMGNSVGNFKEYWDLIRKYPNYQGGYIWDFIDQGLSDVNKEGKKIYTYGGDYGRYPASDNNFNCNGLISPDRVLNPHAYEVKYYYQNVWTTPVDLKAGKVKVYNENFFRTLDYVTLVWKLTANGAEVAKGKMDVNVPAQQTVEYTLNGYKIPSNVADKEVLLEVNYILKKDEPLMKKDEVVAYQQFPVTNYTFPKVADIIACEAQPAPVVVTEKKGKKNEEVVPAPKPLIEKQEQLACMIFEAPRTTVTFNKWTGWIDYLDVDGVPMLEKGYSITPDFWRAPTDNDMGANMHRALRAWLNPEMKMTSFKAEQKDQNWEVVAEYDMPATASKLKMTYTITTKGEVLIDEKLTVDANAKQKPQLFRFGMQLVMPQSYQNITYYGRGPVENYCDRNNNTLIGEYSDKVANQYYGYIRPQESGNKTDIRWWRVLNSEKKGLEFYGIKPMECSTINYLTSDLDDGLEKAQRHSGDLKPRPFSVVHVSDKQMGVGGINSWGTWPLQDYQIPYKDHQFTFVIKPL